MATRRDQLHSYQFMTQRVISAFVMRETDPQQSPLRRGIGAVFGGVMIAVLVGAGFGIYGLLTKVGTDKWKADGAVVVEKETGASFFYFGGELHPTLNFASAMLAAGRPNPPVFRVAGKSLSEAPRGSMRGIPGAPDSLPNAKNRIGLPWTVCATPGIDQSGQTIRTVSLAAGAQPQGGRGLGEEGVLVKDTSQNRTFLVWHGRRHLVQDAADVVPALFRSATAAPVGTAWLTALPIGTDIATITVDDRGAPSPAVSGRRIGDVLVAQTDSGPQHYLVFDDGLATITPLQLGILRAEVPVDPEEVPISEARSAPISSGLPRPADDVAPPESTPELAQPAGSDLLCAVTGDATAPPSLRVGGAVAGLQAATPTSGAGVALADAVLVPAGRVATVRVLASPTAVSGQYFLVTDLGIKYPVPNPNALAMLGYSAEQAVDVPATLVSRIPTGPTLDPEAALQPAAAQ